MSLGVKGNVKDPCGDGNAEYLDCMTFTILNVIPHCKRNRVKDTGNYYFL
jgi:hypothetical protein